MIPASYEVQGKQTREGDVRPVGLIHRNCQDSRTQAYDLKLRVICATAPDTRPGQLEADETDCGSDCTGAESLPQHGSRYSTLIAVTGFRTSIPSGGNVSDTCCG